MCGENYFRSGYYKPYYYIILITLFQFKISSVLCTVLMAAYINCMIAHEF